MWAEKCIFAKYIINTTMNRRLIIALCVMGSTSMASAQTKGGGLSADMLKDIVKEQKQAPVSQALINAVAAWPKTIRMPERSTPISV